MLTRAAILTVHLVDDLSARWVIIRTGDTSDAWMILLRELGYRLFSVTPRYYTSARNHETRQTRGTRVTAIETGLFGSELHVFLLLASLLLSSLSSPLVFLARSLSSGQRQMHRHMVKRRNIAVILRCHPDTTMRALSISFRDEGANEGGIRVN